MHHAGTPQSNGTYAIVTENIKEGMVIYKFFKAITRDQRVAGRAVLVGTRALCSF
jgi:hypothetical protein